MQVFGSTAVYAFAQTVSLIVFVQLWLEACMLQIQSSRVRRKYPETFEYAAIVKGIRKFIAAIAVMIWLIVFATNLNVYVMLQTELLDVLTLQRNVGSFGFTLSGVILFLGIIWIANFLQKYIAYFFGDVGDDAAFDNKGQRSRLLVTRLILLSLGFLLAVAASGLPIDKITVVLGALGVGIGLGLQSIVNNFVSGIILIFDRPLRIGDVVEISNNKGRVKEIGIRSSTLLTEEGAEVIIPNGDVLAHNIVNWTLSNNHIRIHVSFVIEKPFNTDEVVNLLKENILANGNAFVRKEPEILVHNITAKSAEIKAYFWCKDVTKVEQINSEVYAAIYKELEEKGIKIV
jgi:small-conductance mechanosensitive channel